MVDRDAPKSLFTWFIFELARCHEWCPIRSILGPILFLIYINDPDDTIKSLTLKFANDTKVFSNISYISDHGQLQDDVRNLINWSKDGKCCSISTNAKLCTLEDQIKLLILIWTVPNLKND